MGDIRGRDGTVPGEMGTDLCSSHVAPVTGTHRENHAEKGLFSWHRVQPAWGWG